MVGLIDLQILSIIPFLGAIASLFGFGAVLLMAWRTFRQPSAAQPLREPAGDAADGHLTLEEPGSTGRRVPCGRAGRASHGARR